MVAVNKLLSNKVSKIEAALSIILLIMLVYGFVTALYFVSTNNTPAPVHYFSPPTHHIASPVSSRYSTENYDINSSCPTSSPIAQQVTERYKHAHAHMNTTTSGICCMGGCENCDKNKATCSALNKDECTKQNGSWCNYPEHYKQDNIDKGAFCTNMTDGCSNPDKQVSACEFGEPLTMSTCISNDNDGDYAWCDTKTK